MQTFHKNKLPQFALACVVLLSLSFSFMSCGSDSWDYNTTVYTEYKKTDYVPFTRLQKDRAVESYIDSMGEIQALSQLFLVNIEGSKNYSPVETLQDVDPQIQQNGSLVPGGMLFFSYNIGDTPEEIISFTKSIEDYCREHSIVPPYIAVDQEGGSVNRLREITSSFPSNQFVAKYITVAQSQELYSLQAKQMKALGFNLNLAPVAEASFDFNSDFLGTRSFGTVQNTVDFSSSQISAFQKQGLGTTLKHFPGNTNADPHSLLPQINLDPQDFNTMLKEPFAQTLKAHPYAVLMSHAMIQGFDELTPACLSSYWVTDVLKNELSFNGLVISDDIFMAALKKNGYPPEVSVVRAIDSGVHVIMLSEKKYAQALSVLLKKSREDPDFYNKIREAQKKVVYFKIAEGLLEFQKNPQGGYTVKEVQSGDSNIRLEEFNQAKASGQDIYNKYFR